MAHTEDYNAQWGSHLLQIALWGCNVRHHSAWEWCCGRHTGCGFPCLISACLLLPILLQRCPTLKLKRLRIHIKSFWSWPWCRRSLGWCPPKTKKCRWSTENQLCKMRQKITDENSPSYFHSGLPHLQRPLRRLRQPLRHPLHHPPQVWWVTYTIPTPSTKVQLAHPSQNISEHPTPSLFGFGVSVGHSNPWMDDISWPSQAPSVTSASLSEARTLGTAVDTQAVEPSAAWWLCW